MAGLTGLAVILLASGCRQPSPMQPFEPHPDYDKPLPPGQMALRKIDPADYPDFSAAFYQRTYLQEAIRNSLSYLSKPSSRRYFPYLDITHERAVASLKRLLDVLARASSPQELDQLVRREFEVYQSVGCDDRGTVYFTGYYCPIFEGRRQREGPFQYPLYRLPPDLVKDPEGNTLGRKIPTGGITKYFTRREIEEQGLLQGLEIAWLKDPFEAYVCTVQGSAKLRLADGTLYELGYAGNNGHDYVSVGRKMIADGVLSKDQLSLQALIQYFREHPQDVYKYCWQNPRYVFFQERPGGPYGSLNEPVLPYRSIATDKLVFPRACIAFLRTQLPAWNDGQVQRVGYAGFALDQDTGGAIRAAGRCDVFFGVGPAAEALAGRTGAEGKLYYIFVRPELAAQTPTAPGPQQAAAGQR